MSAHRRCRALCLALVALFGCPALAAADSMDLALSRLRVPGGTERCDRPEGLWCPNQLLFERLVSELAVTAGPPVLEPARTLGVRGFQLSATSVMTSIDADDAHWVRGTQGDVLIAGELTNTQRSTVLTWNRLSVRKGLPFGFEISGHGGRAVQSASWSVGAALKLALLEGLRTGIGYAPDLAVRGSLGWVLGGHQVSIATHSLELLLSKPLRGLGEWTLSPIAGLQLLFINVRSGLVDLSPELGASCGDSCDPAVISRNVVRFDRVTQQRGRLIAGVEASRGWAVLTVTGGADLWLPDAEAGGGTGGPLEAQYSLQASAGLRY